MKQMLVEDKSSNVFKVAEGAKVLQAKLNEKEWLTPTPTESILYYVVYMVSMQNMLLQYLNHDVWIRFLAVKVVRWNVTFV